MKELNETSNEFAGAVHIDVLMQNLQFPSRKQNNDKKPYKFFEPIPSCVSGHRHSDSNVGTTEKS